ncbi:ABC-F family ATP-binding cassette domain-containing protein [Thalassobacillus sp. CUG 92003]|uniref:ABC-F family ATP-binding cassette domain-containing protein n=1 Tax=Thalassobacillus sp. CUG 92003 TaxID=2736641 RepID=UPI0015E666FF|nr:ABC-F family ATP-binding cassette domain-containing protein [Thalassobacillus sp. CUG 92003]
MSILAVDQLSKNYGDKQLFQDISFHVSKGQRIGLIGVNGTGKSTLLKVLAGLDSPDQGTMKHAKDFQIEYLPQEPELEEDRTVLEQIYYGNTDVMVTLRKYEEALIALEADPSSQDAQSQLINMQQKMDEQDAWEANTVAKTVLTKLGISAYHKKVSELSGGQKKRVAIAKSLIQPADLLILDEPTNHLDNNTIEWLEDYLAHYRGALIVVTHDRYFLNRVTNLIYELDLGRLYIYEGNYETYLEKKAEREEWELQAEQKLQNTLRRELAWLKRGPKARGTKQKARKERVESLQQESFSRQNQSVDMDIGSTRLGNQVIELKDVSKSFAGVPFIKDFNYLVVPGERLGIIGPNGSGKTTLLNLMAQRLQPDQGEVNLGNTVKIGYYTQDHQEMDEKLRVIEYIKEAAEVITTNKGKEITAEQMLERFLFPRSQQWSYIGRLSGGERRRLYLLRVLMGEPNVLFLDEPTNDLDTETLSILEDYLEQFPGVVITVSHDRYFLDRVVAKLLSFENTGEIQPFYGNYSEYMDEQKQVRQEAVTSETQSEPKQRPERSERKRKLSYREQKEWDTIEDDIMEVENSLDAIKQQIADAGSDIDQVQDLYQAQEDKEKELEAKMERWEELSLLVEEIEKS